MSNYDELAALVGATTPGPWAPYGDTHLPTPHWEVETEGMVQPKICSETTEAAASFIAAARNTLPDLLAENARLRAVLARWDRDEAPLAAEYREDRKIWYCEECGGAAPLRWNVEHTPDCRWLVTRAALQDGS